MRYVSADDPLGAAFAAIRELEPTDPEVAGVLKRVRRRSSRAFRTPRVIAVIALLALGSAAAAAAVKTFSAATGISVRAGDPNARAIGTGEAIALGAPDDVAFGVQLTRDIRFAPGYQSWKAGMIAFQTALGPAGPPRGHAFMTSSALRWQVAEAAVCSWLNYYATSRAAGHTAAANSAAAQIRAAPNWQAITGLTYPSGLGPVVAAVGAGDAKLVRALIDTGQAGQCSPIGPFPPPGLSTAKRRAKLAAAEQLGQREIAADPVARGQGVSDTP